MLKQSDPKVQQYTEIQFLNDENFYLRFCDLTYAPNWNYIGILWYKMDYGSWKILQNTTQLETEYQLCLKQL